MVNPSPLLSDLTSSQPNSPTTNHLLSSSDDIIDHHLSTTAGWSQLLQAILISAAWAFDAQQLFINLFTDARPSWRCTDAHNTACSSADTPCGLPSSSWSWKQPKHSSVVSEWDLECSGQFVSGLPGSAFFAGCLVGGFILAVLADSSLGRKNLLFLSCLSMSIAGVFTSASPNVWVYTVLRSITGLWRALVSPCSLVLSMEIVKEKWRGKVSVLGFFFFTFGFLSLPAFAYIGRDSSWRNLYLWTSLPCLCYSILVYFFVCESPRWLLLRGRREEAMLTLKRLGSIDLGDISDDTSDVVVEKDGSWSMNMLSTLKAFGDRKWALRRLAMVMVIGFGVGMAYYGMPLGVGALGSNLYLSVTLNALAELPAALITLYLVGVFQRRVSVVILTTASCVCGLFCVFLEAGVLRIAVEVVAFFAACSAFNIFLIYCLELFPTCVRNSALSMVRQAIVLGCAAAPVLVAAVRDELGFLNYGVFGGVIGCCGLFVLGLPETKDRGICDTMDEEENKGTVSTSFF